MLNLKKIISLLLVLMLLVGLIPTALAAETTDPTQSTSAPNEESATEPTEEDPTAPMEPTEEPDAPGEEPTPEDDPNAGIATASLDDGIMTAASTTSGVLLFDLSSPYNYTTTLNSQIMVKYRPNGTDAVVTSYLKYMGWHYAQINGVAYKDDPIYCIEPHKDFSASSSGNYVDNGVYISGSGYTQGANTWYAMPESYRTAIGKILLASDALWDITVSVLDTMPLYNGNTALRVATQMLIYEIVTGLRDPDTFVRNSSNGYTSGDVYYNAGVASVDGFANKYNALVSRIVDNDLLPSFVSRYASTAPTIALTGTNTVVTDSNGVVDDFFFSSFGGVVFVHGDNSMTITKIGTVSSSTLFTCTKEIPAPASSTFSLYYTGSSSFQVCVGLNTPVSSELTGYFRLSGNDPPTMEIVKTTDTGTDLEGWRFVIYADEACTEILSGPYITDSQGKIQVTDLPSGTRTVYVQELSHANMYTNAKYHCVDGVRKAVTVSNGTHSTVSFRNEQYPGKVLITKTTEDGLNLSGWRFSIYSNSACTQLLGGPYTTNSQGKITVSNLPIGTYTAYVKELGHTDSVINAMYTCSSTNPQRVSVATGGSVSVAFQNDLKPGGLEIIKTTDTGENLEGWRFVVYSNPECTEILSGPYITDAQGKISVTDLPSGSYTAYVQELSHQDMNINALYRCTDGPRKEVAVSSGAVATVSFRNELYPGKIIITKSTEDGENLSGWQFSIYSDAACSQLIGGPYTTNSQGKIIASDLPSGSYTAYVKETGHTDPAIAAKYVCASDNPQRVSVASGGSYSLSFRNDLSSAGLEIIKTTQGDGDLEGWHFSVYSDSACTQLIGGPYTTNSQGRITVTDLPGGTYDAYVKETGHEDPGIAAKYRCESENPQKVSIAGGAAPSISFHNLLNPGEIRIEKVNHEGAPMAGAKFLLEWSADGTSWAPVVLTDTIQEGGCTSIGLTDGILTSNRNGEVTFSGLWPTAHYRLTEVQAPDGYQLLADYAYVGQLPDGLSLSLKVVNSPMYTLPKTGSHSRIILPVALALCLGTAAVLITRRRKK